MGFGNTVKLAQMAFSLVPKILNSVDVITTFRKVCAVIDAKMMKFTHIQYIITCIAICINNAVGLHLLTNDWQQSCGFRIRYTQQCKPCHYA